MASSPYPRAVGLETPELFIDGPGGRPRQLHHLVGRTFNPVEEGDDLPAQGVGQEADYLLGGRRAVGERADGRHVRTLEY